MERTETSSALSVVTSPSDFQRWNGDLTKQDWKLKMTHCESAADPHSDTLCPLRRRENRDVMRIPLSCIKPPQSYCSTVANLRLASTVNQDIIDEMKHLFSLSAFLSSFEQTKHDSKRLKYFIRGPKYFPQVINVLCSHCAPEGRRQPWAPVTSLLIDRQIKRNKNTEESFRIRTHYKVSPFFSGTFS